MIVAVPYKDETVREQFRGSPQFKMYEVIGRRITDMMVVDVDNVSTVGFLKSFNVDIVLCDTIDEDSVNALDEAGIMAYRGIKGELDIAAFTFLDANLLYDQNKVYSMPEHDHDHECGHDHKEGCNCAECSANCGDGKK